VTSSPVALSLAVRALRSLVVVDRRPSAAEPAHGRPRRRLRSRLRRLRPARLVAPPREAPAIGGEPAMALRIPKGGDLADRLAHTWRVLDLEAGLALAAWSRAPGHDRRRAHRAYRDALAREAWVAALLAQLADATG
jgi:hypothetical protein